MDHQTRRDEQHSQPTSLPMIHEFTRAGRAVTAPAVTTPTSLARRCVHVVGLIDELLSAPAMCGHTVDARDERRCRASPRIERGARERGAGGDDVAS